MMDNLNSESAAGLLPTWAGKPVRHGCDLRLAEHHPGPGQGRGSILRFKLRTDGSDRASWS